MTAAAALCLLAAAACQQKMAAQPKYRPLQASEFFGDGRSARPLVPGTVPRNHLREDRHLYTGRAADAKAKGPAAYVDEFPFPVTEKVLTRGQQRFNIYCSVCHDRVGTGNGMIVLRGYTKPPSFHTDYSRGLYAQGFEVRLRDAPVGYYFDVITNGYGAMPDHASQVPVEDRWAIIAYVRALQLSQHATLRDVPAAKKKLLQARGDGK